MIVARRSAHPALSPSEPAGLAGLVDQPRSMHSGVYWLSEIHQREKRADGARYARLVLDDAQGVLIGLLWPEWLHQLASLRCPCPVFLTGRLRGPADDRCIHVERIRPLRREELEGGAHLLPRRLCPDAALPWLDALVAFQRSLEQPLRGFLGGVLRDPRIGVPFMRCKASQNHHHAWPGGLLAHSMEMLPLVPALVEAVMPDEPDAVAMTQLCLLLHDVGKVLTVGESVRPRSIEASAPHHEAVGLRLMQPHLTALGAVAPWKAEILEYFFLYLAADPSQRGYSKTLLVDIVRQLDQLSTARDIGRGLMPEALAID